MRINNIFTKNWTALLYFVVAFGSATSITACLAPLLPSSSGGGSVFAQDINWLAVEPYPFPSGFPKLKAKKVEKSTASKLHYWSKGTPAEIASFYHDKLGTTGLTRHRASEVNQPNVQTLSYFGWPGKKAVTIQIVESEPSNTSVIITIEPVAVY